MRRHAWAKPQRLEGGGERSVTVEEEVCRRRRRRRKKKTERGIGLELVDPRQENATLIACVLETGFTPYPIDRCHC